MAAETCLPMGDALGACTRYLRRVRAWAASSQVTRRYRCVLVAAAAVLVLVAVGASLFPTGASGASSVLSTLALSGRPWRGMTDAGTAGPSDCSKVHVAMVCAGLNTTRGVATVIKSILAHRTRPLVFHFIVDADAEFALRIMLSSWNTPSLEYDFKLLEHYQQLVSWIPSVHYSGVYGLVKLSLEAMFPKLDRLMAIDTDILFTRDIGELWSMFTRFKTKHALALVENQSDWYLGKMRVRDPWPAIGRGFNTGVMLLRLDRIRAVGWRRLWQRVAGRELEERRAIGKHPFTDLADQDVVNAVFKQQPELVLQLPCEWNLQLSKNGSFRECLDVIRGSAGLRSIGVVHWSSKLKTSQALHDTDALVAQLREAEGIDSAVIRSPDRCAKGTPDTSAELVMWPERLPEKVQEQCAPFRMSALKKRRVHPSFNGCDRHGFYAAAEATLATHTDLRNLQSIIDGLTRTWTGPISISVSATDEDAQEVLAISSVMLPHVCVHVMFDDISDPQTYPEFQLKIFAISMVLTPYVVVVDGVPINEAPWRMLDQAAVFGARFLASKSNNAAVILPTFSCNSECHYVTRDGLRNSLAKGVLSQPLNSDMDYAKFLSGEVMPYGILFTRPFQAAAVLRVPLPIDIANACEYDGAGFSQLELLRSLSTRDYNFFVATDYHVISRDIAGDFALESCFVHVSAFREQKKWKG